LQNTVDLPQIFLRLKPQRQVVNTVQASTKVPENSAPRRPTAAQSASLLLRLLALSSKSRRKPLTRAKLTERMLKRLWNRPRLAPEFLQEVSDWLLGAGWVFFYAGPTYAAVRVTAVANWPRVSTSPIQDDLDDIARGTYRHKQYQHLLWGDSSPDSKTSGDE
jgi:hypothetical protein